MNDSIGWITEHLGVTPTLEYTGGDRGWIGDNPFIFLDTAQNPGARLDARSCRSARQSCSTRRLPAGESDGARDASMKVAVLGTLAPRLGDRGVPGRRRPLGHGFDPDPAIVDESALPARPPVAEPGLPSSSPAGSTSGTLRFTADRAAAVRDADIVWVTFDTPVDDDDRRRRRRTSCGRSKRRFRIWPTAPSCLCSSQLPVGTVRALEQAWADGRRRADRLVRVLAGEPAPRQGDRRLHATPTASSSASATTRARANDRRQLLAPITDRASSGCRSNRRR